MTTILIHIEVETKNKLAKEAKARGVSSAALVRELLKQGLSQNKVLSKNPFQKAVGAIKADDLKHLPTPENLSADVDKILYG